MAEVRARTVFIFLLIAGGIGFVVLVGLGVIGGIGWFNPEFVQKWFKAGVAAGQGYTPAKTPAEAMAKFRTAIQDRDYKNAGLYCTKSYKELLERAHPEASKLAKMMDKIRDYGKNKGYDTDKTTYAFQNLDPFPTNFSVGSEPVMKGDDKAIGLYAFSPIAYKNPNIAADPDWKNSYDLTMFQNVLGPKTVFAGVPIELVKEGQEWKLNIATTATWGTEVTKYVEKAKTYHSALENFDGWMLNNRFDPNTPDQSYEYQILATLKRAKQP